MAKVFGGRLKVALFGSRDENGKHDGKGLFGDIRTAASEFFLGKDDGTGKKQGGIFNTISSGITSSFKSWLTVFFDKKEGESDSQYKDRIYGEFKQKFKNGLPKALDGALIGGALGAMSSGSVIGGILGGPMMGAVMGAAGGFLTQSETFMKWLFGEKVDPNDPSKGRMGGFISKRVQDFVKDHKSKLGLGAVGGAIVGGFAGASKFGILGGLVGGPIAGAILGVATSIAHSSGAFQRFMYGDESHQGIFKMVSNGWKEGVKGRKLNMLGIAGAGMLTGTMLSKFGILGASLLPGGVIGGALAGLGSAILMNADLFKKELFGENDKWVDSQGKSHSYRKGGFFKQLSNNITVNILT
jgi:hypothetical protein